MENIILCTLLYVVVVMVGYSKNNRRRLSTKPTPQSSIYDISCIFTEEATATDPQVSSLQRLKVSELRTLAKKQNIRQPYKLSKAKLIERLESQTTKSCATL